jgi:hypothetical protein
MEVGIRAFFRESVEKLKFYENLTRNASVLLEDRYLFLIMSRLVLLRMRNFSNKICRENQNIFYLRQFFLKSCCLLDNVNEYGRVGKATGDNLVHAYFTLCT